jgi:hypothetical protein
MAPAISNGVVLFLAITLLLGLPAVYIGLFYVPALDVVASSVLIAIIGLLLGSNKRTLFGDNITMMVTSIGIALFFSFFMHFSFIECLGIYAAAFGTGYLLG